MQTTKTRFEAFDRFWVFWRPLTTAVALCFVLTVWVKLSLAQGRPEATYGSPAEASQALYDAIQKDNEQALLHILGGRKELAASGDPQEDKAVRKQFAAKYQEMHRFVRQSDGTWVLYIGAENWPFPIPLVSEKGKWRFDADAGTQEILFRRIGENESIAIEVCHALARVIVENYQQSTSDDVVTHYALNLADAKRDDSSHSHADPFQGYYFRRVSDDTVIADRAVLLVAYPAKYRSSGVMTFLVTSDDVVFQKDLGPNTPKLARAVGKDMPDLSWQVAE